MLETLRYHMMLDVSQQILTGALLVLGGYIKNRKLSAVKQGSMGSGDQNVWKESSVTGHLKPTFVTNRRNNRGLRGESIGK